MENWHGFALERFTFDGREALAAIPSATANGRAILKTEYWDAFPETELELLKRGYHVLYVKNDDRWGTDGCLRRQAAFVRFCSEKYHVSRRVVPIGMSCGGLIALRFAALFPDLVSCLYLDAPVVDLMSCPGVSGGGEREAIRNEVLSVLGLTGPDGLASYRKTPLYELPFLVSTRVPVVLCAGDKDESVPYAENGGKIEKTWNRAGVDLLVRIRHGCGHHPHGLPDPSVIADFIDLH